MNLLWLPSITSPASIALSFRLAMASEASSQLLCFVLPWRDKRKHGSQLQLFFSFSQKSLVGSFRAHTYVMAADAIITCARAGGGSIG
jgi:hypothetical protein